MGTALRIWHGAVLPMQCRRQRRRSGTACSRARTSARMAPRSGEQRLASPPPTLRCRLVHDCPVKLCRSSANELTACGGACSQWSQIWYDDPASLGLKAQVAAMKNLRGKSGNYWAPADNGMIIPANTGKICRCCPRSEAVTAPPIFSGVSCRHRHVASRLSRLQVRPTHVCIPYMILYKYFI